MERKTGLRERELCRFRDHPWGRQVSDNATYHPLIHSEKCGHHPCPGVKQMENRFTSGRSTPSFEEFAAFIRDWAGIPRTKIAPETLFEDDLGITGDDGCELLEATERHFGVCLSSPEDGYRRTFDLAPHECLFHGEGMGWGGANVIGLFRPSLPPSVRAFKVGDLFEAVKNAPTKRIKRGSVLGLDD